MRGELLYKILNLVEDGALEILDINFAILNAGYGASFGRIEYEKDKLSRGRKKYRDERELHRNLSKYISNLKMQGFIDESSKTNKIFITSLGKAKLKSLDNKLLFNKNNFSKEVGDRVIIISYDIPNSFNKERAKLREILKILGFGMVHKSVWVGKVKLPQKFFALLEKMEIVEYLEIMEITKSGTLKSYKENINLT